MISYVEVLFFFGLFRTLKKVEGNSPSTRVRLCRGIRLIGRSRRTGRDAGKGFPADPASWRYMGHYTAW